MPTYSVNAYGYNRVRNSLRALVSAHAKIIDPAVKGWAQSTRGKLKGTPYPPKPANSKYVRTGNLANRFAVKRMGLARYRIDNRATYASYVIGDSGGPLGQAWMHVGRWWQMRPIVEDEMPELRAAIEKGLENI